MADDDSLIDMALEEGKEKMQKALGHLQNELGNIRTGRATPGLVERLRVEYYGTETPLQQIAGFSVPEARMLVISPFDKSSIKNIEKAILGSDLGITPSSDGNVIRLAFPPLTEERRRELVKVAKHKAEEGRVAVRNARRAARQDLDKFEKDGDISSDELERAEKELDKITNGVVAEMDRMAQHKEQELLEV